MSHPLIDHLAAERVTTPFEDWCQSMGVHPEALGAWESFSLSAQSTQSSELAQSA